MILFPPAKLNLGLHITGKREDNFHNLESVFLPIGWTDILEVVLSDDVLKGQAKFTWTGLPIPGDASNNLVVRAHQLLTETHDLPGVSIHLHKILPLGGGVGGGSADGTFALRALNEVCHLGLDAKELQGHAEALGSDCPFFVQDGPALVRGRGENITPLIQIPSLQNWWVVVANPGIHINTAEAFAHVVPKPRQTNWDALGETPVERWHTLIQNDFEVGACRRHDEIGMLIDKLRRAGASYVQMTGSGSTVFGLFREEGLARHAAAHTEADFCGPAMTTPH